MGKEIDTITLNTDVVASISKESTFGSPVTLTLTKILTVSPYVYYWGEADYAAGSGVTMQAQVVTANTKAFEQYGIVHYWR